MEVTEWLLRVRNCLKYNPLNKQLSDGGDDNHFAHILHLETDCDLHELYIASNYQEQGFKPWTFTPEPLDSLEPTNRETVFTKIHCRHEY